MKLLPILLMLAVALITGCVTTATYPQLEAIASESYYKHLPNSFMSYTWYIGSDAKHDYFVVGTLLNSKKYRVTVGSSPVSPRFELGKESRLMKMNREFSIPAENITISEPEVLADPLMWIRKP